MKSKYKVNTEAWTQLFTGLFWLVLLMWATSVVAEWLFY